MHLHKKMIFTTVKLSEFPFPSSHCISSPFFKTLKPSFTLLRTLSFLKTPLPNSPQNRTKTPSSSPWLKKWPTLDPSNPPPLDGNPKTPNLSHPRSKFGEINGQSAIDRIVFRLRNMELNSDDDERDENLGDLLNRDWIRHDAILVGNEGTKGGFGLLPWDREGKEERETEIESGRTAKKVVKAATMAELTIEESELKRLRGQGMVLRDKVNVPKAGLTRDVLEKIHFKWSKFELVRLKFHEDLADDMKTAHTLVERRTGGLVIWRSGSVMVVYRGTNYEGSLSNPLPSTNVSSVENDAFPSVENNISQAMPQKLRESLTADQVECNKLLDGLGPRFTDWWGTGILPIDADLLPQTIPGFVPPLRLLPARTRIGLVDPELTNLRKLAKSLPCHFALGRNRHHQGLAVAIIKLWQKSLVAKIAVKRGIQNTNNKLMSEELKALTGGTLLLRNKYFIVIYRGKDFLPTSVAAAIAERQSLTKQIQEAEEKARITALEATTCDDDGVPLAGTLAEFYEAQSRWARQVSPQEREKMREEASRAKSVKEFKRFDHKLALAQSKKLRAEKLLAKIEGSMIASGPCDDLETITDEEKFTFRRIGLQMKAYLPLGVRGIFDGVIENMHLHWKHRELVKLITKQKNLAFVEESAKLLEYESGGILVAIERIPKGYAIVYYRGKNYQRPFSLRPRNLLTKAKALKRAVAVQRHEALSQHINELEKNIDQMKKELGVTDANENVAHSDAEFDAVAELTNSHDEDSYTDSDNGDEDVESYYSDEDDVDFTYVEDLTLKS